MELWGIVIAGAGLLVGVAVQGGLFAFRLGRHDQRLTSAEESVVELKKKTDDHAAVIASINGMQTLLDEVRKDVKAILTSSRRRTTGD